MIKKSAIWQVGFWLVTALLIISFIGNWRYRGKITLLQRQNQTKANQLTEVLLENQQLANKLTSFESPQGETRSPR